MLKDLLNKLDQAYPDSSVLFHAIKGATVAHGVLTLAVASNLLKDRIDVAMKPDILKVAREIDESIWAIQTQTPDLQR